MQYARSAVFFVALLMAGVHVVEAQEGTGDLRAFENQHRSKSKRARLPMPGEQAAPAVQGKPGEVLVSQERTAAPAAVVVQESSAATVDTILNRLATTPPSAHAAGSSEPVGRGIAPTVAAVERGGAVDQILNRLGSAQAQAAAAIPARIAEVSAAGPGTPSDATVNAIQQRLAVTRRAAVGREVLAANSPAPAPAETPTVAATNLAAPVTAEKREPTLVATVDLSAQRMTVSENGKKLGSWSISSGAKEFPTPTGNFRAEWMAKIWHSRKYDDAPMPHAVFFKNGAAIHGTQSTGSLGRAVSHGCIRLSPSHAETFYKLVQKHGLKSTRIAISGTPHYAPVAAKRQVVVSAPHVAPMPVHPRAISRSGTAYMGVKPQEAPLVWPGDVPVGYGAARAR
jgi:lipoprotein-anchoring transpeptidase ErfK/SrfK